MADPISISASIVALVQASVIVVRYLGDVKDTPHDVGRLRTEIDRLQSVLLPALQRLKRSEDGNLAAGRLIEAQNGPLQELRVMLEDLEKRLAPTAGLRKARQAVTWPFRKSEISDIVGAIERQKSLFILTLQLDHCELLQETRLLCSKAHDNITELAETFAKMTRGHEVSLAAGQHHRDLRTPQTHHKYLEISTTSNRLLISPASKSDMSPDRQRGTSPIPGNVPIPVQVSRPSEPSTEVNMDPVLSILDTKKALLAGVATISLQGIMAPERHEPPPPTQNMPSSRDRNANPTESSMKTTFPSLAHLGHNSRGVNALYDDAIQNLTNTDVTFGPRHKASGYAYDNQRPKGKKRQAEEPSARSAAPEAQNPRASNQTTGGAHGKIKSGGATHYGDNRDGVNAIYRSEQNVNGGSWSFG